MCSIHGQVQCLGAEEQQACKNVEIVNVGLINMALLEMTMQKVHLHKVDLKKAKLWSLQLQKQVRQCQVTEAGDDETCMQVQTCTIQFACNKDMTFLPEINQSKNC